MSNTDFAEAIKVAARELPVIAIEVAENNSWNDATLKISASCATLHLRGCLAASSIALKAGEHSVAITLVRQCIEAVSVFELSLLDESVGGPLMQAWHDGKLTAGNLRAQLQQKAWSSYGDGLWREPWSDFMREFSRAVQTYAHYTQKLSLWQFHALSQPMPGDNGALLFAMHVGPDPDDDEKTNQVAVLHALLLWWIGRILLFHRPEIGACVKPLVESLGTGLRGSGLLAEGYSWADMLLPVVCSTEPRGT